MTKKIIKEDIGYFYGKPVSQMNKRELLQLIKFLVNERENVRKEKMSLEMDLVERIKAEKSTSQDVFMKIYWYVYTFLMGVLLGVVGVVIVKLFL